MYPNLFKQFNLPKLCNDISKTGDIVSQIEVDDREQSKDEEDKYPELSVKTFFDFMRTAYQVNETFDELANTLTASSEIDWSALAKVSLNLGQSHNVTQLDDIAPLDKSLQTVAVKGNNNSDTSLKIENIVSSEKNPNTLAERELLEDNRHAEEKTNNEHMFNKQKCYLLATCCENKKEPLLSKVMKRCLSDVLHEGLLDSVLPHITARPVHSQPIIKKSLIIEPKKSISVPNGFESKVSTGINGNKEKEKDKIKQKKCIEAEVEIHVCDEAKNIKKDFRCPQRLLIQKMCYFAEVTAGQKLEEMDISVHCDIVIFDWLMRWVKKDIIKKSDWPVLEATNVVPVMVSASFLQMDPLLDCCLNFCHTNMSEILKTTTVLSCLNDNLLTKLADLFSNAEVETIKDKKDKIQSRLFCKLIMSLANAKPDQKRGHYASLATLFKCMKCEKNVIRSISNLVPCVPSNMRIDNKGNLHSKHTRDMSWNLNDYIIILRSELRSWRRVYWRLWGDCHFLLCRQCGIYFAVNQMDWCSYHPENPQFFINELQRATPFPLGRYPCCSQRAYRFQAITNRDGCRFKEHVPEIVTERDENIINVFLAYRDIVSIEAPQLFFPEKITRLTARDPNLPEGKLACKEVFWWEGIEIIPPRPKLGLLAKIWGGSNVRKVNQSISQKSIKKVLHQVSQMTDVSSIVSSESYSDEDDDGSHDDLTTCDDESSESDESRDWDSADHLIKKKKKIKTSFLKRCEGMGSWSSNLTVRYNQDNQRDFEEKAAAQMVALLTKRTMLEYNLRPKSHSLGKYGHWNNNAQPLGGTYVRLEAEFLNQVSQNNKCKNSVPTRTLTRIKSSK
ncbi:SANT and BTB domain regulator of class switch recombination isoform X2 [Phymastichus coffea]|uniref:SANT and BTB domain regulator of class switch recombination isoform X2 n=1 Tax=Phymastichus coffea TaxID=108790 RepID=UPI00273B895C|nr:SANT and BTB domain regulator of class switch recombination isoform X2 [Phymastichus coffea]